MTDQMQRLSPRQGEVDTCTSDDLVEKKALVNPKIIMLLGTVAAKPLPLRKMRGLPTFPQCEPHLASLMRMVIMVTVEFER